ncbi:MAG: KTSC domain-containing protein [Ginsengibacter sp.]
MKVSIFRIWIKNIFKSFIWVILPLCIFGNIQSCSSYNEAGTHLSSWSVHVHGYYRRDGTYINPYHRRPPGGVKHDAPYERKQFWMGFLFFICLVGGIGNASFYIFKSLNEIEKLGFEKRKKANQAFPLETYSHSKVSPLDEKKKLTNSQKSTSRIIKNTIQENDANLKIERTEVASSNIRSLGYRLSSFLLQVEFKDGSIYNYYDVPESIYNDFLKSTSKGKFLNNNIAFRFRYEKI